MQRIILHLDLDAFFCAVETQLNPALRGKAFAVGGRPESRGVVSSCSYEARKFGLHSAMPMAEAVRRCPGLIVVPTHFDDYKRASRAVMDRLFQLTPLVEQISIDEAFIDLTGRPESGADLARQIQRTIRQDLDLPCSLGVATSKLVAKIANNQGKANAPAGQMPNAVTVVEPGQEAAFLAVLPVQELWGVGPKTAENLRRMGIQTIGDLARWPENDLIRRWGKNGADLSRRAKGIDTRPVETEHEAKSVSKEITFSRDVRDAEHLRRALVKLAEGVGWRLRRSGQSGTTVKIKLRWSNFTTLTRQITLSQSVNQDGEIYRAAYTLFQENWPVGRPVRLIGVGVSGLEDSNRQLSLWEAPKEQTDRKLQSTLDTLRDRFGDQIIKRGSELSRDFRLDDDD